MNVLYETRLLNPKGELRIYVGIHSLSVSPLWKSDLRSGYIGSGGMFNDQTKKVGYECALKSGWKVLEVTCVKENATLEDEDLLIRESWAKYGVAPECINLVEPGFIVGSCINVSKGSSNLARDEIRGKASDARTEYYRTEEGREDLRNRSKKYTSEQRSHDMRNNPGRLDKWVSAGHSVEARMKRRESYRNSGNAKRVSDLGNAVIMAKGRKCILNDGFVGICSEIAEHTGLKKGSVGAKMSEAYKLGESKCKNWIFRKYDTN